MYRSQLEPQNPLCNHINRTKKYSHIHHNKNVSNNQHKWRFIYHENLKKYKGMQDMN